jgi:hypothetical protein
MPTPEELELARLDSEQSALAEQLAEAELVLESARTELARFRTRYYQQIGRLYAELDQVEADIAAVRAGQHPDDVEVQKEAEAAAVQARASAEESGIKTPPLPPPPDISDECKTAFKRAAMMMHPDRATSEAEKERRHPFMARLNQAYEKGDLMAIERLVSEFGQDPEAIAGEDIGSRMIKTIRRISQIRRRLDEISHEKESVESDEMYQMMTSVAETETLGGKPLDDLASEILAQISAARIELEILVSGKLKNI